MAMHGTAQNAKPSRQLPPTSGSTTGIIIKHRQDFSDQQPVGVDGRRETDAIGHPGLGQWRHRGMHHGDAEAVTMLAA